MNENDREAAVVFENEREIPFCAGVTSADKAKTSFRPTKLRLSEI